jgi:hypothetical protein
MPTCCAGNLIATTTACRNPVEPRAQQRQGVSATLKPKPATSATQTCSLDGGSGKPRRRWHRIFCRVLESMTSSDYNRMLAPLHPHKILRGLFDAYLYTADTRALDLTSGMCGWM